MLCVYTLLTRDDHPYKRLTKAVSHLAIHTAKFVFTSTLCYCVFMIEEIQAKLAKARKRLERIDSMREALAAEISDLEAAIRVIENLAEPPAENGKLTVSDRILAALEEQGQPLSKAELSDQLDQSGEHVKPTTLAGTLQRMSDGGVVFNKDGKWFLAKWRAGAPAN